MMCGQADNRVGVIQPIHERRDGLAVREAFAEPDRASTDQRRRVADRPKGLRCQATAGRADEHREDHRGCNQPPSVHSGILPAVILTAVYPSLVRDGAPRHVHIPSRGEL